MFAELLAAIPLAVLLVTWVGYPLLVTLMASRRRRPALSSPQGESVRVSVVIATRESAQVIRRRIADIFRTEYATDCLEVVVALDAGTQPYPSLQAGSLDPRVHLVHATAGPGKAAALNAGVAAASGDILVFADSYQTFAPDAIPRLVEAFIHPEVGAVSGNLLLPPGRDGATGSLLHRYWEYEVRLRRDEAEWSSCVGVFGPIWAMRRSLWSPLPGGLILDDVYTPLRIVLAGLRVGFAEGARAIDLRPPDPETEFRRKVRTLTGNIQLVLWMPTILDPRRNPIWLQFMLHKVFRLLTPHCLVLFGLGGLLMATRLPRPVLIEAAIALGVLTVPALAWPSARRRLGAMLAWAVRLQYAVLVATLNGMRGHWDVWRR